MRKPTTHFTHDDHLYPSCGLTAGVTAALTDDPKAVTCKSCLGSTPFRKRYPELASPIRRGKKRVEGVVKQHCEFYLPDELILWWDQLDNKAATIVQALQQLQRSQQRKVKRSP
jgi:hypothetical protein